MEKNVVKEEVLKDLSKTYCIKENALRIMFERAFSLGFNFFEIKELVIEFMTTK